jgi:hypothetical protein
VIGILSRALQGCPKKLPLIKGCVWFLRVAFPTLKSSIELSAFLNHQFAEWDLGIS